MLVPAPHSRIVIDHPPEDPAASSCSAAVVIGGNVDLPGESHVLPAATDLGVAVKATPTSEKYSGKTLTGGEVVPA
jgi:hypothetical protein